MSKHAVWDYFTKFESDASKAQCKECKKLFSLGSDKPRLQTVSGLKGHLASCHKELHGMYLKRSMNDGAGRAAKKMMMEEKATRHSLPNFVQTSLTSMVESRMIWPDDHVAVQRIDKCIMDLIVVDMLPYSVVEGEAFKRLNIGDPLSAHRYKVKSEKYYRTTLMPATYDKVVKHVKNLLQEATWISFTTDGWSNPTKSCSLLSFTGHFIHDAVRRKVILNAMVLEEDHDGNYLASKLCEAMTKWEITEKIHVGVRDNAANMKVAIRVAGVTDVGCMSHTLQLVLHDALFTQTSVEAVVKKARKIVTHFKHSEQACRHLVEHQQTVNSPEHSLLQDVETRWNSTYLMLERLVEQHKAINLYSVQRGGIDSLSIAEWELAGRVVKILKPFYTATQEICSDDACISVVIPLVSNLKNMLNTTAADHGLKQMKAALRDAMSRRFSYTRSSASFLAATLLDPRFKDTYFNVQEAAAAKNVVLDFLRSIQESAMNNMTATIGNVEPGLESMETSGSDAQEEADLWAAHDKQPSQNVDSQLSQTDALPPYEQQLVNFLKEPRLPRMTTDIYAYWHCSQYPLLEAAARKYLSAPPTSVASEQLFSAAGQLYADRRSNLLGENAEKLLFLNYNIRLFGYNY